MKRANGRLCGCFDVRRERLIYFYVYFYIRPSLFYYYVLLRVFFVPPFVEDAYNVRVNFSDIDV